MLRLHGHGMGTCLGTSGPPHGASAQGISKLQSSLVARSHLPPAGMQHSILGMPYFGCCLQEAQAHAVVKGCSLCCNFRLQSVDFKVVTFRHGTLPKGFMDRYSLSLCWPFSSATRLSSIARDAHLQGILRVVLSASVAAHG